MPSQPSSSSIRRVVGRLAVLALLAAFAPRAQAQPESEIGARGFHADKVYNLSGIDSVNLFNGNLTLAIPLGIEYPVSEKLSYRFHLTYNSSAWDYEDVEIPGEEVP